MVVQGISEMSGSEAIAPFEKTVKGKPSKACAILRL
jgi:hypothetical protein